jgi:hypothetical protein
MLLALFQLSEQEGVEVAEIALVLADRGFRQGSTLAGHSWEMERLAMLADRGCFERRPMLTH